MSVQMSLKHLNEASFHMKVSSFLLKKVFFSSRKLRTHTEPLSASLLAIFPWSGVCQESKMAQTPPAQVRQRRLARLITGGSVFLFLSSRQTPFTEMQEKYGTRNVANTT